MIDKIIANLAVYHEPQFFTEEHVAKFKKGVHFDGKKVEKYLHLLNSVSWFTKKVGRYQLYFEKFYPASDEITKFEAIEHHVHSYLEDVTTVKNKIEVFLNSLKNDIDEKFTNKDEGKVALKWLSDKIADGFSNISSMRGDHRHRGYKFTDGNLSDTELANFALSDEFPLKSHLSEHGEDLFKKKLHESFSKTQIQWLENARRGSIQINEIVDSIVRKTEFIVYQVLDIQPAEEYCVSKNVFPEQ